MRPLPRTAFTIIELLVTISVIALLIGILMPAIGKVRDVARMTESRSNLRQIGVAAASYAAENADRQISYLPDNIAVYGPDGGSAMYNYYQQFLNTGEHIYFPLIWLGTADYHDSGAFIAGYDEQTAQYGPSPSNEWKFSPMQFSSQYGANGLPGHGTFQLLNARPLQFYFSNRFYDRVFYAPKDAPALDWIEPRLNRWFDWATMGAEGDMNNLIKPSSYCFSPAALFHPNVLALNRTTGLFYTDPWSLPSGLTAPTLAQAQYPGLKTHALEQRWLQRSKGGCFPDDIYTSPTHFTYLRYDDCIPYLFNHSRESSPLVLFYDGHVGEIGQQQAINHDARMTVQAGHGLWSRDTPLGPDGYFGDRGVDETRTSYHILTIDGIRGRDITGN